MDPHNLPNLMQDDNTEFSSASPYGAHFLRIFFLNCHQIID